MEFDIDLVYDGYPDELLIHQILYLLVSRGASYNCGPYPGHHVITGRNVEDAHQHTENEPGDPRVEQLPEIVAKYSDYEARRTTLTIGLGEQRDDAIGFAIGVVPSDSGRTIVSLGADTHVVSSSQQYLRLLEYARIICDRLDIVYGAYRSEYMESTPRECDEILETEIQRFTYFGPDLVSTIGREHLESLPTYRLDELDDGGLFVIVCPTPDGQADRLENAREHGL